MTLRKRIITASAWTLGSSVVEFGIRLVSNLIMTRLLFPEAFGLIAASTSIMIALNLVSDLGIRAVVIQSVHGDDDSFLRSAWAFQLVRGIVLFLVLLAVCALISLPLVRSVLSPGSVFANPIFPWLTLFLGISLVFHGLESTAVALNVRRLNYRPLVLLDLTGKLTSVPVMIAFAIVSPSVWALAIGALAGSLVRTVLSHLMVPGPKMAFVWDKAYIREMTHFGKWITVSSTASFVVSQSDVILFGLLLPSSFLGIYFLAKTLIGTVEGLLERLNGALTLPVLGEVIRTNPANLRDRYYRFRLPIDLAAAACGGFVFMTGSQIISILYDARYAEAGPMLRLFALGLAIYPFQIIRSAFMAVGNTRTIAAVTVIQAGSLVVLLLIGFFTAGPLGAVAGVALSRLVPSAAILLAANGRRWMSVWHELRVVLLFVAGLLLGEMTLMMGRSLAPVALRHFFG